MADGTFTPEPWAAVANSWQHATIYDANGKPLCRFDLLDWDVNEDNQAELERAQAALIRRILHRVHAHDSLVGMLDTAADLLDALAREYPSAAKSAATIRSHLATVAATGAA